MLSKSGRLIVALALLLSQFACLPTFALEPTDRRMLVLKCTGSMLGPVEVSFAPHSFSILHNTGRIIWHDNVPDKVQLLNIENHTALTVPVQECIDDLSMGLKGIAGASQTGPSEVVMADGRKAQQIMYVSKARQNYKVQAVFLPDLKISPQMVQIWARFFSLDPRYGVAVTVRHNKTLKRRDLEKINSVDREWRTLIAYKSLATVPLKTDRFSVPRDYKIARDKSALYFSEDGVLKKEDLDDLFRSEKMR